MDREVVSFANEALTLHGVIYRPQGEGPFPAVLYNHGAAPGMLNDQALDQLGPLFADKGWIFFAPYRRGQGLSEDAGPFIGDQIAAARTDEAWRGFLFAAPVVLLLLYFVARRFAGWRRTAFGVCLGLAAAGAVYVSSTRTASATMVRLHETDHFSDQSAAFHWLSTRPFVQSRHIATAGNSFGGIQAVLGAERLDYCAVVDASGGAESWARSPQLRELMTRTVRHAKAPIFLLQAENDYDLSPSESLAAELKRAGKPFEIKIYPAYGTSASDGHRFAWAGSRIWFADVFQFLSKHCR